MTGRGKGGKGLGSPWLHGQQVLLEKLLPTSLLTVSRCFSPSNHYITMEQWLISIALFQSPPWFCFPIFISVSISALFSGFFQKSFFCFSVYYCSVSINLFFNPYITMEVIYFYYFIQVSPMVSFLKCSLAFSFLVFFWIVPKKLPSALLPTIAEFLSFFKIPYHQEE